MPFSRRSFLAAPMLQALGSSPPRWTSKWDHAILAAAVDRMDAGYDPAEAMLRQKAGPEYRYHTNLRSAVVHATRDSLDYALLLLETQGDRKPERAAAIIDRTLRLQDTDPESKWYGLWGYYLEEPASKMAPADWNWADFLGSLLLTIELRHGPRLGTGLRQRVREAIQHAAYSVRRRNVSMSYTNIAVQGSFVTLAAAELLGDADLYGYAKERWIQFARTVDETGSFAEYNSPTYANVTIANLTRIRMFVKDEGSRKLARRIEQRAWLHLGKHWHSPTEQLAGPMSRCYQTDIGRPAWIQKALDGGVPVLAFNEIPKANVPGEVGMLDYRCPDSASGWFLSLGTSRRHRELFSAAPADVVPVQGTTCLRQEFCLGSVNRGNFWIQSRPLLAYWGGPERPARYLQARVLKDDYDFASALLYSTQEESYVLGVVTFRYPGGDKHPNLDPVKDAQFTCSRLRLRFDLAGVPFNAPFLVNGKLTGATEFPPGSWVTMDVGGSYLWLRTLGAQCGEPAGGVTIEREGELLTVSVDFLKTREPRVVRWPARAVAAFALGMRSSDQDSLEECDRRFTGFTLAAQAAGDVARLAWNTPAGKLGLEAPAQVSEAGEMDRAFRDTRNGAFVPLERLSNEKLV